MLEDTHVGQEFYKRAAQDAYRIADAIAARKPQKNLPPISEPTMKTHDLLILADNHAEHCGIAGYVCENRHREILENALRLKEHALEEWFDKTDWVQATSRPQELGLHRAYALKLRIQELTKALSDVLAEGVTQERPTHTRWVTEPTQAALSAAALLKSLGEAK